MTLLLSLASRNTLRHTRRSALTALTVLLGTALLTAGLSWVGGIWSAMFRAGTQSTGHVRIVTQGFADREQLQPLYENIPSSDAVVAMAKATPGVVGAYPRIAMGVAASSEGDVFGEIFGQLVGAPVAYFDEVLELRPRVREGRFFSADPAEAEGEALLGATLADQMGVGPGQEAIFLGQTQDGSISPIKVIVAGVVDTGNGLFDRQIYVPLAKARWMADIPDGALEVIVFADDPDQAEPLLARLQPQLAALSGPAGLGEGGLIAQAWYQREPWSTMVVLARTILFIVGGIIVFITALGVLNTMLMSVLERTAEIGVLRALGLGVGGVVVLFVGEALAISSVGGAVGVALGSLASLWLERHGLDLGSAASNMSTTLPVNRVLYADWTPEVALAAFGLALVMALIGSASPALRAARVQPVSAMRAKR